MHVMSGQMHNIVDRESDNDDHGDRLTDAELPATEHHDCNDGHDDENDRDDRVKRDKQVPRRDQQDEERTDRRDRDTDLHTIKEGLLALHPSPEDVSFLVDNFEAN